MPFCLNPNCQPSRSCVFLSSNTHQAFTSRLAKSSAPSSTGHHLLLCQICRDTHEIQDGKVVVSVTHPVTLSPSQACLCATLQISSNANAKVRRRQQQLLSCCPALPIRILAIFLLFTVLLSPAQMADTTLPIHPSHLWPGLHPPQQPLFSRPTAVAASPSQQHHTTS